MTYNLSFLPEVEDDLIVGYLWYEEKALGLGDEFLRTFYARANELSHNSLLYQKVYSDFRRSLLRRFPYAIYYRLEEDTVVVFGLFHYAINPKNIQDQLLGRNVL